MKISASLVLCWMICSSCAGRSVSDREALLTTEEIAPLLVVSPVATEAPPPAGQLERHIPQPPTHEPLILQVPDPQAAHPAMLEEKTDQQRDSAMLVLVPGPSPR